jgi:hypothetical protein
LAILTPTSIVGCVVFLGVVPDRAASLRSVAVEALDLNFAGIAGDCHAGLTRASCSRVTAQYPERGTPIRNTRQVSILSDEELAETAAALGLPRLAPEWVGANLVLQGIPRLTCLPPASRLVFSGGAVLTVDVENEPCQFPAREIEREHPGLGRGYKAAARGRRGLTAWVEREGRIVRGERVVLHAPPQRVYPPLGGA